MPRLISTTQHHRIKAATRDLIALAGGGRRAAGLVDRADSTVSRWQSPEYEDLIPIDCVIALEAECGATPFLRALADLAGVTVGGPTGDIAKDHAAVIAATGAMMQDVAAALADGRVTAAEARRIDDHVTEVERGLSRLRIDLAALMAGGGR